MNPYISTFDEGFDAEKSSQYRMAIQFALGGLSFALFDTTTHRVIGLECYQTDDADSLETFQLLERALDAKKLNHSDFHSVLCIFDNRLNTLVPSELFDEAIMSNYLDFTSQIPENHTICADHLKSVSCHNVFAQHRTLKNKFLEKWSNAETIHSSTVFIEGAMQTDTQGVFVNVRNRDFDMLIKKEGNLLFYNNFKFHTKEDFAYFLLFAMEQNHVSGLEVPVTFSGLILPASDIMELCGRYVEDIRLVEETPDKMLDGVPFQYYYIHYQALR